MSNIDYMKVIDIISKTFGANKEVDLKAAHDRRDKTDKFDITMTLSDGSHFSYRILLFRHELDVIMDKNSIDDKQFKKWVSSFEYELEQSLFINIHLSVTDEINEYQVKVTF
jgi:hypothetical protein